MTRRTPPCIWPRFQVYPTPWRWQWRAVSPAAPESPSSTLASRAPTARRVLATARSASALPPPLSTWQARPSNNLPWIQLAYPPRQTSLQQPRGSAEFHPIRQRAALSFHWRRAQRLYRRTARHLLQHRDYGGKRTGGFRLDVGKSLHRRLILRSHRRGAGLR